MMKRVLTLLTVVWLLCVLALPAAAQGHYETRQGEV